MRTIKTRRRRSPLEFTAILESDVESGGYTAYIPELPGCISEGRDFEETIQNIHEAADLYLSVMRRRRSALPVRPSRVIVAPVRVRG